MPATKPEPRWLTIARQQLGVAEITGPRSNPRILAWAQAIGGWIASFFKDDDIPWCGLFVAWVMLQAGYKPTQAALGAASWASWGDPVARGAPGVILVFKRSGGGHVGFYVGEDATAYHVLGGNQSNQVSIKRIEKSRCIAMRWPKGAKERPGDPVMRKPDGTISSNEA